MEKLNEAFEALGGKTTSSNIESLGWTINEGTIREVFNQYHNIRGEANVYLLSARSAKDIASLSVKVLEAAALAAVLAASTVVMVAAAVGRKSF